MKIPWDSKYLKISFHVIFTIVIIYILKIIVDLIAYVFVNFGATVGTVGSGLWSFISLLSPLIIALIIAYLLDAIVEFFQRHYDILHNKKIKLLLQKNSFYNKRLKKKGQTKYKKRIAGSIFAYLSIVCVIAIIVVTVVLKIGSNDTGSFTGDFNVTVANMIQRFEEFYNSFEVTLERWGVLDFLSKYIDQLIDAVGKLLESVATSFLNALSSIGSGIVNFVLAIVIAFYFMVNKQFMKEKTLEAMDVFIPEKQNKIIINTFADIHNVFYHYIQGTLLDATIMAFLLGGWLSLVGVNFAVLIGVISGFSNIIPFVGAFVGFVLAIVTALISGNPIQALWAAVGIFVIQQIDGIFIQPKVVGTSVKISPVLVLLSLSIGGALFGLTGMILAVPTCAIIKMFSERFYKRQKALREVKEKS